MKSWMRIFFGITLTLFLLGGVPQYAAADTWDEDNALRTASAAQVIQGDWYNLQGERVLQVDKQSVNTCPIINITKTVWMVGHFEMTILEKDGERKLNIGDRYIRNGCIYYQGMPLRKDNKARHFETVGGVGLMMSVKEVIDVLGVPDTVTGASYKGFTWRYHEKGLKITFNPAAVSIVTAITLLKDSPLRFETSGLNCKSSLKDFSFKYGIGNIIVGPDGAFGSIMYPIHDVKTDKATEEGLVFKGKADAIEGIELFAL